MPEVHPEAAAAVVAAAAEEEVVAAALAVASVPSAEAAAEAEVVMVAAAAVETVVAATTAAAAIAEVLACRIPKSRYSPLCLANLADLHCMSRYGPPRNTEYRVIVENLSSRVSWQVC